MSNGETVHHFGRRLCLQLVPGSGRPAVLLQGDTLLLRTPQDSTAEHRMKLLKRWQRGQLAARIPALLDTWQPVLGVQAAEWRIRRMKTRWGTCNTRARRVWLNLELATRPPHCLEYVVVHELMHLLERGHGPRFQALMDHHLPAWRSIRAELNSAPPL